MPEQRLKLGKDASARQRSTDWCCLGKIIVIYSENCNEHTNALHVQNAELLNVKAGGTYSYHRVVNVKNCAGHNSCQKSRDFDLILKFSDVLHRRFLYYLRNKDCFNENEKKQRQMNGARARVDWPEL
jgi:hypothetical protein